MNPVLTKALYDLAKVNAAMDHLGNLCSENSEDLSSAFYVLADEVRCIAEDLNRLVEDSQIVDVINAIKNN